MLSKDCAKSYRENAQSQLACVQYVVYNALMSLHYFKSKNKKKLITIAGIAKRYGIHRNTASKIVSSIKPNLYDLDSTMALLLRFDFETSKFDEDPLRRLPVTKYTRAIMLFDLLIYFVGEDRAMKMLKDNNLENLVKEMSELEKNI